MMEMQAFKRKLFTALIVGVLASLGLGLVAGWVTYSVAEQELFVSVIAGSVVGAIAGASIAMWASHLAADPVDYIQRSLNILAHEGAHETLPDPEKLPVGKEVTRHILKDIFDLTTNQHETQTAAVDQSQYFQSLVELSPSAVVVLDRNRVVRYANAIARELLSGTPEEAVGASLEKAIRLEFPSQNTLSAWLDKAEASSVQETETWQRVKVVTNDGVERYFDLAAHFSKSETHGLETVLTLVDFSELYQADSREISFVSLAVHELRSLVTILRGYIEVFEDEIGPKVPPEHQGFMRKMQATAAQLSTFVNNILNVSRIDNEQMSIHMQKETWKEVIESSANDLALRAEVRNRHLKITIAEGLPEVAVDRISIFEVLYNLIDNAVKYSHDGGQIELNVVLSANGEVETTVTDHGIGIPANLMPHLFDKFYRSHRSRENIGGTGLGLYLSKQIVEAHGGTIWSKSTEGEGAQFGFTIQPYEAVASQLKDGENGMVRSAHGWIMNHAKVRR